MSSSDDPSNQPPQKKARLEKEPEEPRHQFSADCPPSQPRPEKPKPDQCRDQHLFASRVEDHSTCPIGMGVLPFQRKYSLVTPCGQTFCSACITSSLKIKPQCPACREGPLSVDSLQQQPVSMAAILGSLTTTCDNSTVGCPWQGAWSSLDSHLVVCDWEWAESRFKGKGCTCAGPRRDVVQHEAECQFRPAKCELCSASLVVKDIQAHADKECPKVAAKCEHCGEQMLRSLLEHHSQMCPQRILDCEHRPFGCFAKFKWSEKEQHLAACPAAAISRQFSQLKTEKEKWQMEANFFRTLFGERIRQTIENGEDLFEASESGDSARVEELLCCGECPNQRTMRHGETPLYLAAQNGHLESLKILLSFGASTELCSDDGTSPLCVASLNGHADVVHHLLSAGANRDQPDQEGISPLYAACQEGHTVAVRHLLLFGANVNHSTQDGSTPLATASELGHIDVVRPLLLHGADTNRPCVNGATPLFHACQSGHAEIAQLLIAHGANINDSTDDGKTPLFSACRKGRLETVQLLLSVGADVDKASTDGATPLYIACDQGHTEVAHVLLAHGANRDLKSDGMTPLEIAQEKGHREIVELFSKKNSS